MFSAYLFSIDTHTKTVRGEVYDRKGEIRLIEIGEGCQCVPDALSLVMHMEEIVDFLKGERKKLEGGIADLLLQSMHNETMRLEDQEMKEV